MKAETTAEILRRIDETLATIGQPTRSTWTTREIEDLLLDMRNDIWAWMALERHADDLIEKTEAMLRECARD